MNIVDVILGPTFGKVLDKIFPNPADKAAAQFQVMQLQQAGEFKTIDVELQRDIAQAKINEVEAASPDTFRGGWRPFIGWVCGVAIAYNFLGQPLLAWGSLAYWKVQIPPQLDINELMTLIGGMLGLGGMRSYERVKGVVSKSK